MTSPQRYAPRNVRPLTRLRLGCLFGASVGGLSARAHREEDRMMSKTQVVNTACRRVVPAALLSILSFAPQGVASAIPPNLSQIAPFVGMNGVYVQGARESGDPGELTPLRKSRILSYVRRKMRVKGVRILGEFRPETSTDPILNVIIGAQSWQECSDGGSVPVKVTIFLALSDQVTRSGRPGAGILQATTWLEGNSTTTRLWLSEDPSSLDKCMIETITGPLDDFISLYLKANPRTSQK